MAAIKGWVYLILGVIMGISSQLIKYEDGNKPLRVFLFVGILFAIIGIGKYVFKRAPKIEQKEPGYNLENQAQARHQQHRTQQAHHQARQSFNQQANPSFEQPSMHLSRGQHHIQKASNQLPEHASIVACPLCATRHYDYAHYCMRCGARIKGIRER